MQPIKKIMGFNTEEPDKPTKLTIQGPCNKTLGRIILLDDRTGKWVTPGKRVISGGHV
jgi:hypothetical protein